MFSALNSGKTKSILERDCQGLPFVKKLYYTGILEACF